MNFPTGVLCLTVVCEIAFAVCNLIIVLLVCVACSLFALECIICCLLFNVCCVCFVVRLFYCILLIVCVYVLCVNVLFVVSGVNVVCRECCCVQLVVRATTSFVLCFL